MRKGVFEVEEPLPELKDPYVFAILHPWINVSGVGTLVLNELETRFGAGELDGDFEFALSHPVG